VKKLLTFDELPHMEEIMRRSHTLAEIALFARADEAMIEGPPYFILFLSSALMMREIEPVYAFEQPKVLLNIGPLKISVSCHLGFIRPGPFSTQATFSLKGRGGANVQEKSAGKVTEKE